MVLSFSVSLLGFMYKKNEIIFLNLIEVRYDSKERSLFHFYKGIFDTEIDLLFFKFKIPKK
tara:strand:+ start:5490 stop:5672 length:183 start_codon:yes stop_codon:yes gene_type:complete